MPCYRGQKQGRAKREQVQTFSESRPSLLRGLGRDGWEAPTMGGSTGSRRYFRSATHMRNLLKVAKEERIARQDLEELLGRDAMVALKLSDALPSQQLKEAPKVGAKMPVSEKRRATDDADDDALKEEESKRTKATESDAPAGNPAPTTSTLAQAFPYIPATALLMMSPPSTEDMEAVLLQIRKDSLLKQYSVN